MEIDNMSDNFLEICTIIFTDLTFKKIGVELLAECIIEEIIFDILLIVFNPGANN